ncbi:MAG: hypothetical protein F6K37_03745 [Moorea sp. SIO4E2]|uniref:hypothetical protein n=1 Tax=Moorena sp. SIO4E2 TaxID=2607826 RepID=UPI0013BB4ADF|nr:hypothetical protein [Moorena sp. SIO4E2]NEQ05119.1 hypothetical protein [Moorena sp. SIO4E2]
MSENLQEFPPITDPSPHYRLAITHYRLAITHYLLPITYYLLPISKVKNLPLSGDGDWEMGRW